MRSLRSATLIPLRRKAGTVSDVQHFNPSPVDAKQHSIRPDNDLA